MKKTTTVAHPFGSAIYAAKRAADIVFILQNKDQVSRTMLSKQLGETLKAYGEQNPKLSSTDLDELIVASQKLHAIFAAENTAGAADSINLLLDEYASPPRLSAHGKTPWHLHVDSDDHAPWAEWFMASSALALATLLSEMQRNPGGLCASSTCRRPYIDLGKGGGRNYCSPRCATRERVAAYRKAKNFRGPARLELK